MSGDGWNSMPGQPRVCAGCSRRLTWKDELWLRTGPGTPESWHVACFHAARRARIEAAIGETAADYDRAEHAQLVLDMIDGRGTEPTERAASAPPTSEAENPQIAGAR